MALDFPRLQNSILTPHGNSVSPVRVHCVPRSRDRLGAQAKPRCVALASHSTSVNPSFFIFKMKKFWESF